MGLTSLLLIGLLGVFLVLLFKRPLITMLGENNSLINLLENRKWFQKHWLSGLFLFAMNAVLFFLTGMLLYMTSYFLIPYIHLPIMIAAVLVSLLLWMVINHAWQGNNRDRLKMGMLGSSFYAGLSLLFIYWLITLEPSYPGEDTFMRAIGFMLGTIVTTVAFISCLVMTGFSKTKISK